MLFNEPKLLKLEGTVRSPRANASFSALQRAEIAEIVLTDPTLTLIVGFSALQRAEIAEIAGRVRLRERRLLFQCSSTSRNC